MSFHDLWASPFWQGIAGTILVNTLQALGIGTFLLAFLRYGIGVVWEGRQLIFGGASLAIVVFLTLFAIRFNTISAKESTISSLQASVAQLNKTLKAPHLTIEQQSKLKTVLKQGPDISSQLWIMSYPFCLRCRAYAWEFANTMDEIPKPQWQHSVGVLAGEDAQRQFELSTSWRGVIIGTRDPKHLNPDQATLVKALLAANITYSFEPLVFTYKDQKGAMVEPQVVLLIAPQQEQE